MTLPSATVPAQTIPPAVPTGKDAPPTFTPPRWVSWLIAFIPIFPPLYLAAFGCLGSLRLLPLRARQVVFFFAATQLVAAVFTPRPLLSLALAAARTLLILAMIGAGVYLRDSRNLRPLLWGQLVICATAWIYTLATQGWAGVQARLGHPYYYIVSLGLVAVIALWFIIFWKGGSLWWRIPAGLFAFVTFLATGSRGPLLALVVGSIASGILLLRSKKYIWQQLLVLTLVFISTVIVSMNTAYAAFNPLKRFATDQTSGRPQIWQSAVYGWTTSIFGGVGPYQGGYYLIPLYKDGCMLTPTLERNQIRCPENLDDLSNFWLIAHNAWIHWVLESGIIGLTGLIVIMVFCLVKSLNCNGGFVIAILFGFTAMNLIDVVIAVPSLHFSELWWSIVGLALSNKNIFDNE